jgi:hypothetical protein
VYYAIPTDNHFKGVMLVLIRLNSWVNKGGVIIKNPDVFHSV